MGSKGSGRKKNRKKRKSKKQTFEEDKRELARAGRVEEERRAAAVE